MKKEKKESPIGVLWGWGKSYHGKFISSIILAVLGVTCQMVPYFCVAHIVTLMLAGEQNLSFYVTASIIALCGYLESAVFLPFYNGFPHGDLLHATRLEGEYHSKTGSCPDGNDFGYSVWSI